MRKRDLKRRLAEARESERRAVGSGRRTMRHATRLQLAIEALPDAVAVFDEEAKALFRNRNGWEQAGLVALMDAEVDATVAACTGDEGCTRTLEYHGPPPKALVITAVPLRAEGERFGTVVLVDDISERRQLEAVRRDFVANVSHELRTPIGALALLGEALSGELEPEVIARLAGRVLAEADRAGRMIEDLLDLSRIEAEGLQGPQLVNIDAVVSSAVERVGPLADLREVKVATESDPGGLHIEGEESQLVSAVANLVDNAVKYSDVGSTVKVKIRASGSWVDISVRDRGIGIPAKDLERIFERFYRVDRARSRETGGTGLGLSIVRHVATNHGGEVLVVSNEGSGSTFTLRLPATDAGPT
ncbi:MAG: ATP-binding protein [Actinomycetota bacterium]|nr:ATP-binding protein [Actinomycetota bacterium]